MSAGTVRRVEVLGYSNDKRPPWNNLAQAVLNPVSDATARKRHQAGSHYGVVVRDAEGLVAIAVGPSSDRFARVEFLDPSERTPTLAHHLVGIGDDNGLRLRTAWRHNGGTRTVPREQLVVDTFTWDDAGTSATWHRAGAAGGELVETRDGFDPDDLRTSWPAFGEYEPLVDRGLLARVWPGLPDLPFLGP